MEEAGTINLNPMPTGMQDQRSSSPSVLGCRPRHSALSELRDALFESRVTLGGVSSLPRDLDIRSVGITQIDHDATASEEGLLVCARSTSQQTFSATTRGRIEGVPFQLVVETSLTQPIGGRPARTPFWVSHQSGKPGTAGCVLRDKNHDLYIVSAAHVIGGIRGEALPGDPVYWAPPITHGPDERWAADDAKIGTFVNGYFPTENGKNYHDLAIARLDKKHADQFIRAPGIVNIGRLSSFGAAPRLGEPVSYSPASGERIRTRVRAVDVIAKLDFWGREYVFRELCQIQNRTQATKRRLGQQGHSGSVVVNGNRQPIGLAFYMDSLSIYTCSMEPVFGDLGLIPWRIEHPDGMLV